jgi:SAM-dependent methyltransferase
MNGEIKENVTRRGIWLRFCFMIMMIFAFGVAEVVVSAVVAFQFLSSLFTGRTNDQLIQLGRNLARYLQQITAYLTFATEDVPFPFDNWPDEPHGDTQEDEEDAAVDELSEIIDDPVEEDPANPDDEATEQSVADVAEVPVQETPPQVTDTVAEEEMAADETISADPVQEIEASSAEDNAEKTASEDSGEVDPEEAAAVESKSATASQTAVFADGDAYQKFMGERSKLGGREFVKLLDLPPRLSWLDVGCGTGVFSGVVLEYCDPIALIGIDRSEEQIILAQKKLGSSHASFRAGDATKLPFEADSFDVAVSSYVLNFVPEKQRMVDEMARVVRPEGTVAISVFDVAGGRQSSHHIWDLIQKKDAAFHKSEFEKRGWDITHPEALAAFFEMAGLEYTAVNSIEVDETFSDFDEYWESATSMPTSGVSLFLKSLDQVGRVEFRDEIKSLVPVEPDGGITLNSASWVVHGKVPA